MTIEQKIKRGTLDTSLHHLLRRPVKRPQRTARNLSELADTLSGGKLGEEEKKALRLRLETLLPGGDREEIRSLLLQAAGL